MAPIVDEPEKQQIADATPADTAGAKRKRKREKEKENKRSKAAGAEAVPAVVAEPTGIAPAVRKPRVERVPEKPVKPVVETLDEAVAQMNPQLTVDYITRKLRHFEKDLSSVEMDDRLLKESAFLDATTFTPARNLANLPAYLEHFAPKTPSPYSLDECAQTPGSPHTLIITAAAVRATHVVRAVRKYQTRDTLVAKFFAKHIKLKETIELCNSTRIGMGVGTPARILELLRDGCLKTDKLVRIVLDMSAVNEKKQGLFDIKEVNKHVLDLLNEEAIKERLGEGVKLLVY